MNGNKRLAMLKTVLWAILGALVVVTVARFWRGLGATTALSDTTPWGFWIAFDVMAGVALAAGGFTLAATVYIFGRQRYRAFARPAILTALLGYAAVAVGLLYDLGLPWHIWHPIVHPQPHSVLFEVAMCVMLYLAVLFLEFGPTFLEHPFFGRPLLQKIHHLLKRVAIPLVIAGIVLSTLHQSSLGSLFLIAPYRLHPLWYSPLIWVLFFVSAVGLGLMMVIAESFFSSWFFGHRLRLSLLAGLGRAASAVLLLYAVVRLADLAVRGGLHLAVDGSWQGALFIFELAVSAVIPGLLLIFRPIRQNRVGLATCCAMTVLGMIGYRFDVCIVAFARPAEMPYFPAWTEVAVSLGIVAGAMLVFVFFVERMKVYSQSHSDRESVGPARLEEQAFDPSTVRSLLPGALANPRHQTMAAMIAAAVAVALLPRGVLLGADLVETPVWPTRTMPGEVQAGGRSTPLMIIDGNRDGRAVSFPHELHIAAHGQQRSCALCHHQNAPLDTNTACSECHRDMYTITDVFSHPTHLEKLGGNAGCPRCHQKGDGPKTRANSSKCKTCHEHMLVKDAAIVPSQGGLTGLAVGYMDAMHGLCITCHRGLAEKRPAEVGEDLAECATCHRSTAALQMRLPGSGASPFEE